MSLHTLHIYNGKQIIDSEEDFSVVTIDMSGHEAYEVNNLTFQEYSDENGEEVFIPTDGVKFKSYDCTVKLGVRDTIVNGVLKKAKLLKDTFMSLITGKELIISHDFYDVTMNGCVVTKFKPVEEWKEHIIFEVVFRVTKPTDKTQMPSREPIYSTPVVSVEYPPIVVDAEGGMAYIRSKSYSQKKTTTLIDGTTQEEIITIGGTWEFSFRDNVDFATINPTTGTVTFKENKTTTERKVIVIAKVTLNGQVGMTLSKSITQKAAVAHNPIYIGQINATATEFANIPSTQLLNNATSINGRDNWVTNVSSWVYYVLIADDAEFEYLHYSSGGELGYVRSIEDFNCPHDDVVLNGITYKVLAMRTEPQNDDYTLKIRFK